MTELRLLDLFAGIGGFSYAAERLLTGFRTTQFVEWDNACQKVLSKHWPEIPIHSDIRDFHAKPQDFDVITAGFPCQDISIAGKLRGLKGERSGLFYDVIRLLREIRPKYAIFENVKNLVSHNNGETFQEVLYQIAAAGYDAEWSIISAKDVGACHLRNRIWILAYPNNAGLQRQRPEHELPKSSSEVTPAWRDRGHLLSPQWRSYRAKPLLRRGDDGLRGRVDRLKQLGNAIVPQVATVPLGRILELEAAKRS